MSRSTIQAAFDNIAAQTRKNSISPEMVAGAMSDHLAEAVLQDELTAALADKAAANHTHSMSDLTDLQRHIDGGHAGYIENSDALMSMSEFWRIFKRCILEGNNVYLQHSTADGDADDNIHFDYIPGLRSLSDRITQKADADHNHDAAYPALSDFNNLQQDVLDLQAGWEIDKDIVNYTTTAQAVTDADNIYNSIFN